MAFTQARAIALINTALEFKSAIDRIRAHSEVVKHELNIGNTDYETAFKSLSLFISSNDSLFDDYVRVLTILTTEHAHFSRNVRRNAYEAERARERRARTQPDRRAYHQHSQPYETTQMNPITYRPPGMNSRGDLPTSHITATSLNPPKQPSKSMELTEEEFEAAVAAAGGVYKPNTDLEAEERRIMQEEEALRGKWEDSK